MISSVIHGPVDGPFDIRLTVVWFGRKFIAGNEFARHFRWQ